jgi:hypothetical protein
MKSTTVMPNVGVPDPELRTSPIFDEEDDELMSLDQEMETAGCFFNSVRYPLGGYVRSGNEVLRCSGRGVWVRQE